MTPGRGPVGSVGSTAGPGGGPSAGGGPAGGGDEAVVVGATVVEVAVGLGEPWVTGVRDSPYTGGGGDGSAGGGGGAGGGATGA